MEFRNLYNRCTVSTVLILPLFTDILTDIKVVSKDIMHYTIQGLFYDQGLINCYLYDEYNLEDNTTLKLVFDKEKILENNIFINKPLNCLFDIIISSKPFIRAKLHNNLIIIYLQIDPQFQDDIVHIENSEYSKVSNQYKQLTLLTGNKLISKDETINYLYLKNIPAKILYKSKSLKDVIKEIYDVPDKFIEDTELFIKFDKKRETFKHE